MSYCIEQSGPGAASYPERAGTEKNLRDIFAAVGIDLDEATLSAAFTEADKHGHAEISISTDWNVRSTIKVSRDPALSEDSGYSLVHGPGVHSGLSRKQVEKEVARIFDGNGVVLEDAEFSDLFDRLRTTEETVLTRTVKLPVRETVILRKD